jgi:mono/diheme cytochrome c family protein
MDPKFSTTAILTTCVFLLTVCLFAAVVIIQNDVIPAGGTSNAMPAIPTVQQQTVEHPGKKIFEANCKTCHRIHKRLVGPALAGVLERRDSLWVIKMIRNSSQLIASGDPTAVKLFEEYNGLQMTSFASFSDADLRSLLEYLKLESENKPEDAPGPSTVALKE